MRKPFECNHPDEQTTLRRRTIGPANLMLGNQCGNCGRLVGTWVKKERAPDPQSLPEWDYAIEPRWEEQEKKYRLEYRAWRVERDGVAAFAKGDAEQKSRDELFWAKYSEYLASEAWRDKRQVVLTRAHGVCEGCGLAAATQVHHLTYARVGREMLFDLVAICDECHEVVHGEAA